MPVNVPQLNNREMPATTAQSRYSKLIYSINTPTVAGVNVGGTSGMDQRIYIRGLAQTAGSALKSPWMVCATGNARF